MKSVRVQQVLRQWAGLVVAVAMAGAAAAAPRDQVDVPPELVPADSSPAWRAFGAPSDFQAPAPGEFRLSVGADSATAGFARTFHLRAPEGRAYVITASIKVDGDGQATAQLWARIDDANRRKVSLANQGNAPVRSGTGWQEASIAIYVPPGPFTLNLGGFASGRAQVAFAHLRVAPRMPAADAPLGAEARSYLLEALEKVESISLFAPPQGWPALREWTLAQAAGARTTSDTYPALQLALQQLQDRHSFFTLPVQAPARGPSGRVDSAAASFGSEPGVLSIPAFMDRSEGAFERYAAGLREALAAKVRERPCGLVVDLRDNGGGNMWPMLVGISALFPDQVLGQFVTARTTQAWTARDGIISLGDRPVLASVAGTYLRDVPLAVLVGPGTASSGEAVAMALRSRPHTVLVGRPTADYVTANQLVDLRDGASIAVSASRMADPAGRIQDGPVQPALSGPGGMGDLEVARGWLATQCR